MPANGVLTTIAYSPAALMTYHYGKVPNSDFSYAFVVTAADENFRRLKASAASGDSYYHKMAAYESSADFPDTSVAGPLQQLDIRNRMLRQ